MSQLFPHLPPHTIRFVQDLPKALHAIYPLKASHQRDLPAAIADLSRQLTSERSGLTRPYWSSPRFVAAYLYYFLPWNILRQARLLQSLPLSSPAPVQPHSTAGEEHTAAPVQRLLVDIGSGPLTLPLALWSAYPQWHTVPLTILAIDASPHILELGRRLFEHIAPNAPWRIHLRRGGVESLAQHVRRMDTSPWLITAANVLNELRTQAEQDTEDRFMALTEQCTSLLRTPDARALFLEPGTRLGGKTIMLLRSLAMQNGLMPFSPCPHDGVCALQESRTWCHFTFTTQGSPSWLESLSQKASLHKEALSLSFLLLGQRSAHSEKATPLKTPAPQGKNTGSPASKPIQARIVSAPFAVPGLKGEARYACTEKGLTLLENTRHSPSGALVTVTLPQKPLRDGKSHALIIPESGVETTKEDRKQAAAPPKARPRSQSPLPQTDKKFRKMNKKSK